MTNVGLGSGAGLRGNQGLISLLRAQRRYSDKALSINTKSLNELNKSFFRYSDILGNFISKFDRADNLQKKTLSVNTNLTKFLDANSKQLKGLRGGFFDNAEEFLKNFDEGIRDNIEGLNQLQNRMRLTGQSTDLSRKVASNLLLSTKGNTESIDKFSKSNIKIAKDNLVSNEKLIEAVNGLEAILDVPTLLGATEHLSELSMELVGAAKGLGTKDIQKMLSYLTDPEKMGSQITMGLTGITDKLLGLNGETVQESKRAFIEAINKIDQFTEKNVISNVKGYKALFTQNIANAYVGQDILASNQNVLAAINLGNKVNSELKTNNDEYYNTMENLNVEAHNFYEQMTKELIPTVTEYLPLIAAGGLAFGGAGLARGAGSLLTSIGKGAAGGRVGGPWGMAAGALIAGGYGIYELVKSYNKSSDIQKNILEVNKQIRDKDKKPEEKAKSLSMSDIMVEAVSAWKLREDRSKQAIESSNDRVVVELQKIYSALRVKNPPTSKAGL